MSRSRGQRIKEVTGRGADQTDVFFMSLEEARNLIANQYEFLAEKYERRRPRKMKPNQN